MTWMDDELEWNWGIKAVYNGANSGASKTIKNNSNRCLLRNSLLDFTDVEHEKLNGESYMIR